MESTGVYWVPVYEALSAMGLNVALVDGRSAKALPGRKTDVQDCQWIRDLYMYGLVRTCMVPDAQTLEIRSYWRLRQRLIEQRSEQILLMQKSLEQMNIQMHKVLKDISGVSGMAMIRAILAGERDPERLAELVKGPVKNGRDTFVAALQGTWASHHLYALSDAVSQYDFLAERMKDLDERLDECVAKMSGTDKQSRPPAGKPRKNQPTFDLKTRLEDVLGTDATVISGLSAPTVMTLVSEYGTDLNSFPSEKHFTSHLGLAPNNRITGGRRKSGKTRKVASRSATALRLAAQSLHRSQCALGAYLRRMRARVGPQKATVATARKIAIAYYRLVRHGIVFEDIGAEAYQDTIRNQRVRALQRQATKYGLSLVEAAPG
jgi:transposase